MKHLSKRIAALALALAMTLTLTSWASAADYADMPDNWAKAPMEAAVEAGLLQGNNGRLDPTGPLTRAQMAAILVRAFGATQSADVSKFTDVKAGAWYVTQNAVPGAVFMQIMNGNSDGTFEPDKAIPREQAFAILARALKLEAGVAEDLNKFKDGDKVSSWFVGEIAAMTKAGYINGNDGWLNPKNNISRQEFAQVMYNIFGVYINEAGTYTEMGEKAVMISAHDATIENATIKGDVIIGEGVGEGDVFFKNTTIEGRVVVRGGGVNSIHFISSSTDSVLVAKIEGPVRIVMDEASEVSTVSVVTGKDAVTVEGNVRAIKAVSETPVTVKNGTVATIEVGTTAAVTLDKATVGTMEINVAEANVALTNESTVHTLEIPQEADGIKVTGEEGTQIGIINADSDIVVDGDLTVNEINGTGEVNDAEGQPVQPNPDVPMPEEVEDVFCTHDWKGDPAWNDGEAVSEENQATKPGNGKVQMPTCCASGSQNMICSKCGATKTVSLDPTGEHVYGTLDGKPVTDVTKITAENLESSGAVITMKNNKSHTFTCITPGCGYTKDADHELVKVKDTDKDTDPKKCALCVYQESKALDATNADGHDHTCHYSATANDFEPADEADADENIQYSLKPTCCEPGTKVFQCEETWEDDEGNTVRCDGIRIEMIAPTGQHEWKVVKPEYDEAGEMTNKATATDSAGWKVTPQTEGTCMTEAILVRECKTDGCGYTETKLGSKDPTNHADETGVDFGATDGTNADGLKDCTVTKMTAGKKCGKCGNVISEPTKDNTWTVYDSHEFPETADETTGQKKCTHTGCEVIELCSKHDWETAEAKSTCKNCGLTCEHKDAKDKSTLTYTTKAVTDPETKVVTYTHVATCSVCGYKSDETACTGGDPIENSAVEATCKAPGHEANKKCTKCGQTIVGATIAQKDHVWSDGTGEGNTFPAGTCKLGCGTVHAHKTAQQQTVSNENGTHSVVCTECHAVISTTKCTYGDDHTCTVCGGGEPTKYIAGTKANTHTKVYVSTGKAVSADETDKACSGWTAENGYKCATCGQAHSHSGWTYTKKENDATKHTKACTCGYSEEETCVPTGNWLQTDGANTHYKACEHACGNHLNVGNCDNTAEAACTSCGRDATG